MRLEAALLPPPEVRDDLAARIRTVPGSSIQLTAVPSDRLYLRLAAFGTVTRGDAETLRTALVADLARRPPINLRFSGGTALEPIGDDSVWAHLEGDTDPLDELGQILVKEALKVGFAVDRRISRRRVRVAHIKAATTVEFLESALATLEAYAGPWWECREVSLLRPVTDDSGPQGVGFEVWNRVPLAGGAAPLTSWAQPSAPSAT